MNLPLCFLHEVPNTWHSVALAGRSSWRLLRHSRTYHESIFDEVLARSGGYLLRARWLLLLVYRLDQYGRERRIYNSREDLGSR
jgi:hypothetical protein